MIDKEKLVPFFLLIGAAIGAVCYLDLQEISMLFAVLGGFCLGFGIMLFTSVYSGTVWGIRIKATLSARVKVWLGFFGVIFGGISLVVTMLKVVVSLFGGDFATLLIHLIPFGLLAAISPYIAKIYLEKTCASGNEGLVLGQLPLFQEIDAAMVTASHFVVGFEGVALYNTANYCYAVYRYTNYQLGELTTPAEVALVGSYFVQKYHEKFTFNLQFEVIPGEPGHTVVAVGTGGIGIARVQGTKDQKLFSSYVFTRK